MIDRERGYAQLLNGEGVRLISSEIFNSFTGEKMKCIYQRENERVQLEIHRLIREREKERA